MAVNALVALALYKPFDIAGIVIGTVAGTLVMTVAQGWLLRARLRGIEGIEMLSAGLRMLAASGLLAAVCYGAWSALDDLLGASLPAQAVAVGAAIAAGVGAYGAAVLALGIPEAGQLRALLLRRRSS